MPSPHCPGRPSTAGLAATDRIVSTNVATAAAVTARLVGNRQDLAAGWFGPGSGGGNGSGPAGGPSPVDEQDGDPARAAPTATRVICQPVMPPAVTTRTMVAGTGTTGAGPVASVQWPPADPGWPAGRPSMRRRTPYPAGRKPACSQNGRDNGLAVSKSTETQW